MTILYAFFNSLTRAWISFQSMYVRVCVLTIQRYNSLYKYKKIKKEIKKFFLWPRQSL